MGNNAETVRTVYEAFAKGDVGTVLGAMADPIDWKEPVSLPYEDQRSPQDVGQNIFGRVITDIDGFAATPREIVDAGDVVFGIGVYTGTGAKTGVKLESDFVHVWRFGSDGKLVGFRTYSDTHLWREALGVS